MTLNESQMRAYREARREGLRPQTALYAAREPVLTLDWLSHYQVDGEWAEFERNGHRYKVTVVDPVAIEGRCESCAELHEAWQERDENIAWLTDDEYEAMEHRALRVTMLDADGEETNHEGSLWGVCGLRRTPTEVRMDDRYVAETVLELVSEADASWERAEKHKADAEAARLERAHWMELEAVNEGDLRVWIETGELVGVVSEEAGGIILYCHRGRADELTEMVRNRK